MDSLFSSIKDWLTGWLWDAISAWLGKLFGWAASALIQLGITLFNKLIGLSIDLLSKDPTTWNSGVGWSVINTINTSFVTLGGLLVVLFWFIGMCADHMDIRMAFRFEVLVKEFMRVIIAEYIVVNSLLIFRSFFSFVDYLTGSIFPSSSDFNVTTNSTIDTYLQNPGTGMEAVGWGITCFFIALMFAVALTACGCVILYLAYIRLFKVLIVAPYGSIATSTFAAHSTISHTGIAYFKYALSTILEAVTMIIALRICEGLINSGSIGIVDASLSGGMYACLWMVDKMFIAFVTLGGVKESGAITQRALGL